MESSSRREMMSTSRPLLKTPEHILNWLMTEDAATTQRYLAELRHENFAHHLHANKTAYVICHALTTNDIKTINYQKLKLAVQELQKTKPPITMNKAVDPTVIIMLILDALNVILNYLSSHNICSKLRNNRVAHQKFIDSLAGFSGNNPYANFSGMHISDVNLSHKNFQWANFSGARFKNVNLANANCESANFNGAKFKNVNFQNANLHGSNLSDASVDGNLRGCDLNGADIRWANLEKARELPPIETVSLAAFLQTNHPGKVYLRTPAIHELTEALESIRSQLVSEHLNERCLLKETQQNVNRHRYNIILAENITKIAHQASNPRSGIDLLNAAITHPLFTEQRSARFAKHLNNGVMKAHQLFGQPTKSTPYLGSLAQDMLIHSKKKLERQLQVEQIPLHSKVVNTSV